MANSFYYVDGAGNSHTVYIAGTTTDQLVLRNSEHGYDEPESEDVIEETPNALGDVYRASVYKPRTYGYTVRLKDTSAAALETSIGDWCDWHRKRLGEGYVKRVTAGATTRCLDCIPQKPDIGEWEGFSVQIKQEYLAAWPWWRAETVTTAGGSFNGTNAVNVACNNVGDIPSPPVMTITGVIETPKIAVTDGSYIQVVKTTANADDTLVITCRPYGTKRLTAWYYVNGVGAGTPCQLSSDSRYIELPVGNYNAVLTAASGTAAIVFSWYPYYGSLY